MSPAIPLVLALFSLGLMPGSGLRRADDMMDLFAATLGSLKYWRKIYVSHYEEVMLGQCWLDFLLEMGNSSPTLPMPHAASRTEREVSQTILRNVNREALETLKPLKEPFPPSEESNKTYFMNRSTVFVLWNLDAGNYESPPAATMDRRDRSYAQDNPGNSEDGRDTSRKSYRGTSYKFSRVTDDASGPLSPVTSASPSTPKKRHQYGFRPLSRGQASPMLRTLSASKSVENGRGPRARGRRSGDLEGEEPPKVLYGSQSSETSGFDDTSLWQTVFVNAQAQHESKRLHDFHYFFGRNIKRKNEGNSYEDVLVKSWNKSTFEWNRNFSGLIARDAIQILTVDNTDIQPTQSHPRIHPRKKEVNLPVIHESGSRKTNRPLPGQLIINSKQLYRRAIRNDWPGKKGSGESRGRTGESSLKEVEAGEEDRPRPTGAVSSGDVKGQRFMADYGKTSSETRQNSASSKDQGRPSSAIAIEGSSPHPGTLASSSLFNLRGAFMALLKILRYLDHLTRQITGLARSNRALACTTDYLWIKFFRWIDS